MEHFARERVVSTEPTEVSDQELVARCQRGDEAAFDDLVRRHQKRALNVAYQLLRDYEDATEVAQDAFVRIYRSIGEFRGECEFTTWLHQVVVNLARNKHRWWRRRGKGQTVSLDSPIETEEGPYEMQTAAPTDAPDAVVVKAEFVQSVNTAIAALPAPFREVLILRNVENLSYEEIAVVLKCSVGTVKSRIARAREAMREKMPNEDLSKHQS